MYAKGVSYEAPFVSHYSLHFEYFSCFRKLISAKNKNRIYGDSYYSEECGIEGIVNHAQNTMVLLVQAKYESIRDTIEIKYSKEYNVIDNEVKPIRGKGTLTLLFLPGSNMDLKWFAFPEYCE